MFQGCERFEAYVWGEFVGASDDLNEAIAITDREGEKDHAPPSDRFVLDRETAHVHGGAQLDKSAFLDHGIFQVKP